MTNDLNWLFVDTDHKLKTSNAKTDVFIIRSENREETRKSIQDKLIEQQIPFIQHQVSSLSGFDITEFTTDKKHRIVYKPLKGGGSGAGARVTAIGEVAQCLFGALRFHVFDGDIRQDQMITYNQYQEAWKYCNTDIQLVEVISELSNDWKESSIIGANLLWEEYQDSANLVFHRSNGIVPTIETTFKIIKGKEKLSINLNKWSPSDIYLYDNIKANKIHVDFTDIGSLDSLNAKMKSLYTDEILSGISLKKMKTDGVYENINLGIKPKKASYKLGRFHSTTIADPFRSMDVYIRWGHHTKDEIQFRSFGMGDGLTGWQGEIKGQFANQGKISLGPINEVLKLYEMETLPESKWVAKKLRDGDYHSIIMDMHNIMTKYKIIDMSDDEFITKCLTKPYKWMYSKFLGSKLLDIMESNPDKHHEVTNEFYLYASSQGSFSSVYGKLQTCQNIPTQSGS